MSPWGRARPAPPLRIRLTGVSGTRFAAPWSLAREISVLPETARATGTQAEEAVKSIWPAQFSPPNAHSIALLRATLWPIDGRPATRHSVPDEQGHEHG